MGGLGVDVVSVCCFVLLFTTLAHVEKHRGMFRKHVKTLPFLFM